MNHVSGPASPGTSSRLALAALALAIAAALSAPAAAGAACPNEALRIGASALLPECRAYEMVSPPDKNGGGVRQRTEVKVGSSSADGVSFFSSAAFAGAPGNPTLTSYVSRRGADNWSTESVGAPISNPAGLVIKTAVTSPDLSKTLQYSRVALTPGAIEGGSNVYLEDNASGERELVAAVEGSKLFNSLAGAQLKGYAAGTPDWSRLTFTTNVPLLPEAPALETIYEYSGGELRVASRLPDETVSPTGGRVPVAPTAHAPYSNAMSADGSRLYFLTGTSGAKPLYLREDGETVAVSASQRSGEEGAIADADFVSATPDGSRALFTSRANLTDESETFNRITIFRYDAESGDLTDLLPAINPPLGAEVRRVLATSEDGSYIYFVSPNALTEGSVPAPSLGTNMYVWHEGGLELIAQLTDKARQTSGPSQRIASPSGEHFAFATAEPLSPEDPPSAACPSTLSDNEMCQDVYAYDAISGELTCVTCTGAPAAGDSDLGGQAVHERGLGDIWPHSVLDDGSVFVDTPNRLLPGDINGIGDVYRWRAGALTAISTGRSTSVSDFGDTDPSGGTIFIRTAEPLVGQDFDQSVDLYGVRLGGGLAGQFPPAAPPPCEGESCRGALPPPVVGPQPTTIAPRANGNIPARCTRLERRARRAERRAKRLRRRVRKASKRRAKRLRRQLKGKRKGARRLQRKARNCGGRNR